ncbi:hypothetical protein TEQG_05858 [Trichophyton equinum CBS 127.97]|uniref:Uncharacterized protein n=1 Tax=Trichophyton equinum (strain ATCC MYA-4606 / CBS 127.97) TaxID=559882 RepID=F2PYL8_TRIEC|nr:hypothetical protein TEQG_05858 [Trichophyton equinum CBS 127.97]
MPLLDIASPASPPLFSSLDGGLCTRDSPASLDVRHPREKQPYWRMDVPVPWEQTSGMVKNGKVRALAIIFHAQDGVASASEESCKESIEGRFRTESPSSQDGSYSLPGQMERAC